MLGAAAVGLLAVGCEKESGSQGSGPDRVSPAVLAAFEALYPGAEQVRWEVKGDYAVANFYWSGVRAAGVAANRAAWFENGDGAWSMTETDIRFDQLPEAVKRAFAEGEYADWRVDEVDMLDRDGVEVVYVVEVERDGRECGCGRKGCLETYVSATGIKRTAFELMAKMSAPSKLRDIAFGDFDASMISAAAEQGDPIALEAFRFTGEMLGRALADVVTVTSPEAIFLFGGLSKAGKLIFEPTQWYMEENMLFAFKNKVKLLPSGIQGKNAAILGASALIWQEEHK